MANIIGDSTDATVSAVKGTNSGKNLMAFGGSPVGVEGESNAEVGASDPGIAGVGVRGHSINSQGIGVRGSAKLIGVLGEVMPDPIVVPAGGTGVQGVNHGNGTGVLGQSKTGTGVSGQSDTGPGVDGSSDTGHGVHGQSRTNHAVHGESAAGRGVVGVSQTFVGVTGQSMSSDGVLGTSDTGIGVHGKGGKLAGFFEGDVQVTGDIRLLNADCAEDFDIADPDSAEPGTVMVLSDAGELRESCQAYDKRVVGVVSGAGQYKPGIILDNQRTSANRRPIALLGKVYCKVDAQFGEVEVGDLLTSSPTPGHAMKATDPYKAFGSVIGKALCSKTDGQGIIPVLVALQ